MDAYRIWGPLDFIWVVLQCNQHRYVFSYHDKIPAAVLAIWLSFCDGSLWQSWCVLFLDTQIYQSQECSNIKTDHLLGRKNHTKTTLKNKAQLWFRNPSTFSCSIALAVGDQEIQPEESVKSSVPRAGQSFRNFFCKSFASSLGRVALRLDTQAFPGSSLSARAHQSLLGPVPFLRVFPNKHILINT